MTKHPLHLRNGHLFIEIDNKLWLVDTGASSSFGISSAALAQMTGVECEGILGTDLLHQYDSIIDVPGGEMSMATEMLLHDGVSVFMQDSSSGIPMIYPLIDGIEYKMFLDTGAQLSYFQNHSITDYPIAGTVEDFHPTIGKFETYTYDVPITLGGITFTLPCGMLPPNLEKWLPQSDGIIGNEIFSKRSVGYFPRRCLLTL